MPLRAPAPLSRRRFVATAAGFTGLAGLAVAGGCAVPVPDGAPDPLAPVLWAATRDARELAAADASHGDSAAALRRFAEARRIHAERLSEEVRRESNGAAEDTADGTLTAPEGPGGDGVAESAPVVCPPVDEVRARLRSDARTAGEVAVSADGYRSELAASVSAACTAALEVVLA